MPTFDSASRIRSSANTRELILVLLSETPNALGNWSKSSSKIRLNKKGDNGSPCFTPRSNLTLDIVTLPHEMTVLAPL